MVRVDIKENSVFALYKWGDAFSSPNKIIKLYIFMEGYIINISIH